ncbi:hypothetical protein H6F51_03760 [Cyanobacteria bacterium FACHB-DQ100]|nr:hypothetical protein [Cyanobacteria bacterium FACHB-DQ100]
MTLISNQKLMKLFAFTGLATVLLSTELTLAKEMQGWKVEGSGTGIVEGQNYSLYNLDQKGYLGYQDRRGANLGWDKSPNQGMKLKRKSPGRGAIKCGELFALFVEKEWIIYEKQTTGINLSSRTQLADDRYQWKFTNCQANDVIQLNQPVTLTNTVENDSVVGCKRVWGVNLCWANTVFSFRGSNYHKDVVPRP